MSRSARSAVLSVALFLLFAAAGGASAAETKLKVKTYPNSGFPDITDEQRALEDVPFAKGAPAVLLLEAEQDHWEELDRIRVNYIRRLKILTEAGVEDYSDFEYELRGDWRIKEIDARTVLPDGTSVDASEGTFQKRSKSSGLQEISIAFPQVQVGAILDLHVTLTIDAWSVDPWYFQSDLPTMRSEIIIIPPYGLKFRRAVMGLPSERVLEKTFNAHGVKAHAFTVLDVEPLPDVANRPPTSEIAGKVLIIVDSYKDSNSFFPLAGSWEVYVEAQTEYVADWVKRDHKQAAALAREVTGGKESPLEKAEAIRKVLRDRVRMEYYSSGYINDSADGVLEEGADTSGGIARAALTMLREVGVDADVAKIRRRSYGLMPSDIPIPSLFNDVIVRIENGDEYVYFSPVSDLPVGELPWDCQGILAVVLNEKNLTPETIPDFKSSDNRWKRVTEATLDADGALTGSTKMTFQGVAAERWRRSLRERDEEAQHDRIENSLQSWVPSLQLASFELEELEDVSKPFVVTCEWEADGYVTSAGSRLLINPYLFSRVSADDSPELERSVGIDLDAPYQVNGKLKLELPEGAEIKVPDHVTLDAKPAGTFKNRFGMIGNALVVDRRMRLDMYRYPPESYKDLRNWMLGIAKADDEMIAITVP